jgi:hypothetical protein
VGAVIKELSVASEKYAGNGIICLFFAELFGTQSMINVFSVFE